MQSHIFTHRDVSEGTQGWTTTLRHDDNVYECSGYDYVLDFISEIEVPPEFPYSRSYYFVQPENYVTPIYKDM